MNFRDNFLLHSWMRYDSEKTSGTQSLKRKRTQELLNPIRKRRKTDPIELLDERRKRVSFINIQNEIDFEVFAEELRNFVKMLQSNRKNTRKLATANAQTFFTLVEESFKEFPLEKVKKHLEEYKGNETFKKMFRGLNKDTKYHFCLRLWKLGFNVTDTLFFLETDIDDDIAESNTLFDFMRSRCSAEELHKILFLTPIDLEFIRSRFIKNTLPNRRPRNKEQWRKRLLYLDAGIFYTSNNWLVEGQTPIDKVYRRRLNEIWDNRHSRAERRWESVRPLISNKLLDKGADIVIDIIGSYFIAWNVVKTA